MRKRHIAAAFGFALSLDGRGGLRPGRRHRRSPTRRLLQDLRGQDDRLRAGHDGHRPHRRLGGGDEEAGRSSGHEVRDPRSAVQRGRRRAGDHLADRGEARRSRRSQSRRPVLRQAAEARRRGRHSRRSDQYAVELQFRRLCRRRLDRHRRGGGAGHRSTNAAPARAARSPFCRASRPRGRTAA